MKAWITALGLLASTCPALAIEGRYKVEGQSPAQAQVYRGEAAVKKSGDTYAVIWQVGSSRYAGTGILTGSVLSVVFRGANAQSAGVASFEVAGQKITSGRWTMLGGQGLGSEKWTAED